MRNLKVMGEAAKHVSTELTKRHPEIPWRSITGVRDRAAHDYFGINYEIIWNIVAEELPPLRVMLQRIVNA